MSNEEKLLMRIWQALWLVMVACGTIGYSDNHHPIAKSIAGYIGVILFVMLWFLVKR